MSRPDPRRPAVTRFSIDSGGGIAGIIKTLLPIADYDDREGYDPDFLLPAGSVPMPRLAAAKKADAAKVTGGGTHLHYTNFSVVISKSRRMCFYSACNIDGKKRKKSPRSNQWRRDPRVKTELQILEECYGKDQDGFFSRGHMTRREDPVWGPKAMAVLAEKDTFHVTNAVPQMQGHNGAIWLSLEDHVLQNADKSDQKVSVFTGPVLKKSDQVIHKVKIPVQLWKVVAFVRPKTKRLSAVAYLDSQAEFLPDTGGPSFVWGQFKGLQVPVERIEQLTGLNFGPLKKADVLAGAGPAFALSVTRVQDVLLR
jgi:endonuclease G